MLILNTNFFPHSPSSHPQNYIRDHYCSFISMAKFKEALTSMVIQAQCLLEFYTLGASLTLRSSCLCV